MDRDSEQPTPAPADQARDQQVPAPQQAPADPYRFTDWASI